MDKYIKPYWSFLHRGVDRVSLHGRKSFVDILTSSEELKSFC
jgi:hypothetical protein